MDKRMQKGQEIFKQGLVYFLEGTTFHVSSQSNPDEAYTVDIQKRTCTCKDSGVCKHLIAAKLWFDANGVWKRAQHVVWNNPSWYAGQNRVVSETGKAKVYVTASQQKLLLIYQEGTKVVRVQCGFLSPAWKWSLTEAEYQRWVEKIKES